MISYLFNNNSKIDIKYLSNIFIKKYNVEIVDKNKENIVLGNTDMFIDIGKKYISILLYDDKINLKPAKDYLLEK